MSNGWKLTVLFLLIWSGINTWRQLDQAQQFMAQGQRFTAEDGQALCERVAKLEPQPQECRYGRQFLEQRK